MFDKVWEINFTYNDLIWAWFIDSDTDICYVTKNILIDVTKNNAQVICEPVNDVVSIGSFLITAQLLFKQIFRFYFKRTICPNILASTCSGLPVLI
jgi:hypothetical protein